MMSVFKKKGVSPSLEMSKPQPMVVHGIEVKKMPLGAYIRFAQKGGSLIPMVMDKLFPDMSTTEIIGSALSLDKNSLFQALAQILVEAPQVAMEALSELLGVGVDELMENPNIGPSELLDILDAWKEFNDLASFFERASKLFPRP